MSNRSVKSAAALFAGILAGINLAAMTDVRAKDAAEDCLLAPKSTTPAGGHWYYRIDHATKRKCWYLRDEDGKRVRNIPPEPAPASASQDTDPAPLPPRRTVGKSVADAHAELPPPQTRMGPDPGTDPVSSIQEVSPARASSSGPPQNDATAPNAIAPASPVAQRWPDPTDVLTSRNAQIAAANQPASASYNTDTQPQPVVATVTPAMTDPSMAKQSASMQKLFLVMAGALALAGISASLVFRFGRRRTAQPAIRSGRRATWDKINNESSSRPARSSPAMYSGGHPAWREISEHGDPQAPDDPDRRMTELLSRLARTAQD